MLVREARFSSDVDRIPAMPYTDRMTTDCGPRAYVAQIVRPVSGDHRPRGDRRAARIARKQRPGFSVSKVSREVR